MPKNICHYNILFILQTVPAFIPFNLEFHFRCKSCQLKRVTFTPATLSDSVSQQPPNMLLRTPAPSVPLHFLSPIHLIFHWFHLCLISPCTIHIPLSHTHVAKCCLYLHSLSSCTTLLDYQFFFRYLLSA